VLPSGKVVVDTLTHHPQRGCALQADAKTGLVTAAEQIADLTDEIERHRLFTQDLSGADGFSARLGR
jgi:hypothetical protein